MRAGGALALETADLGFDAGPFVASGTQSNLNALMAHCQRGDEYRVGADAHTHYFELEQRLVAEELLLLVGG